MEVAKKVEDVIKEHLGVVLALLVVLVLLVVYLVYLSRKNGMSMMPFDAVGPTNTNYNQVSDQVGVGGTADFNVNETGAQVLSDPNFGCATNVPWSGEDAWAWQVAAGSAPDAQAAVQGFKANPYKVGMSSRPGFTGHPLARPAHPAHFGMRTAGHAFTSRPNQGQDRFKTRQPFSVSSGVDAGTLSAIAMGH